MPKHAKRVLDLSAAQAAAPKRLSEKQLARYQKEYAAAVNGTARWLKKLRLASTYLKKCQRETDRLAKLLR